MLFNSSFFDSLRVLRISQSSKVNGLRGWVFSLASRLLFDDVQPTFSIPQLDLKNFSMLMFHWSKPPLPMIVALSTYTWLPVESKSIPVDKHTSCPNVYIGTPDYFALAFIIFLMINAWAADPDWQLTNTTRATIFLGKCARLILMFYVVLPVMCSWS